jgi:hypothetical protein
MPTSLLHQNNFKACVRHPFLHVSEVNGGSRGARAQGTCIVCEKKRLNWYCIECGNWCCNNKSLPNASSKYFRDINTYIGQNGTSHHITGKLTCLMTSHP